MSHLDLSDDEEAVLAVELVQLISRAKYPFSDRVRTFGAILNKLRPEAAREPLPLKHYAPPYRGIQIFCPWALGSLLGRSTN